MSDVRLTTFQIMSRFVLPLLALGLSACAPFARYETAGTLAGQSVETRVDSREAAYYLESYLPGELADPDLATHIDETLAEVDPAPADREGLSELSRTVSTDFATMHFVSRLYADAGNRRMQDRFREEGRGMEGPISSLFLEVSRRHVRSVLELAEHVDPQCFTVVDDIRDSSGSRSRAATLSRRRRFGLRK